VDAAQLALRREIFESFAATGSPPDLPHHELAALERAHVVVCREGKIYMAHPFAAHRWGTRVEGAHGRSWWGNCAWDGLGIVAALGLHDAVVTSGEVTLRVRDGAPVDGGRFEVAVPARHWWDDIEHT
jgi:hypothetical protein